MMFNFMKQSYMVGQVLFDINTLLYTTGEVLKLTTKIQNKKLYIYIYNLLKIYFYHFKNVQSHGKTLELIFSDEHVFNIFKSIYYENYLNRPFKLPQTIYLLNKNIIKNKITK